MPDTYAKDLETYPIEDRTIYSEKVNLDPLDVFALGRCSPIRLLILSESECSIMKVCIGENPLGQQFGRFYFSYIFYFSSVKLIICMFEQQTTITKDCQININLQAQRKM